MDMLIAPTIRLLISVLVALLLFSSPSSAQTFTTLSDPFSVGNTYADGISGNNVLGYYYDGSGNANTFVYNLSTGIYTPFSDPAGYSTVGTGIDGSNIVGNYYGNGGGAFLYNGSTFSSVSDPLGTETFAEGISGNEIAGYYTKGETANGFTYNLVTNTYTTLNDPLGVEGTYILGVSGSNVVGYYVDSTDGDHGFFYNGSTLTFSTLPNMYGEGVSGTDVVGYWSTNGTSYTSYIYNGSTKTPITDPLATSGQTYAVGINANDIVGNFGGTYNGVTGGYGFVEAVPEPSTLVLLKVGLGPLVYLLVGRLRRRRTVS